VIVAPSRTLIAASSPLPRTSEGGSVTPARAIRSRSLAISSNSFRSGLLVRA
jgi:hypothetical protein